ncbi:MAG: hypothetical protein AAFP78_03850 [Pseudomonadota bacterium]
MIWQIGFALVALAFFSLVFQLERIVEKRLGRAPLWLRVAGVLIPALALGTALTLMVPPDGPQPNMWVIVGTVFAARLLWDFAIQPLLDRRPGKDAP